MGTYRQVFMETKYSSIENANRKHKSAVSASERHNKTSYDKFLEQAHDLERFGEIERGTAKEWAREQIKIVSK